MWTLHHYISSFKKILPPPNNKYWKKRVLLYNLYFHFKWFIHFWRAKRKLNFIQSLIHRLSKPELIACHFTYAVLPILWLWNSGFLICFSQCRQLIVHCAQLISVWKESYHQGIAGGCGPQSLPVTKSENQKRSKIYSTPPLFCHNYKSSRHIYFIRDWLNASNNPLRWNW